MESFGPSVFVEVLRRAAELSGGKERLRAALRVPPTHLEAWLAGRSVPPADVFLKAVDIVSSPEQAVQSALEDAIAASGADMGNVQRHSGDGLCIVAQRGFRQPFLDFFAQVRDASSACGAALMQLERIVVPDVASHPLFAGTAAGEVLAAAGVRAVQSTPLLAASGALLGVLSTHYSSPYLPSERELALIDRLARRAASLLESRPA
jgi:GAF domain-containing protein